jgi:lysophospholipase L1-like esterase
MFRLEYKENETGKMVKSDMDKVKKALEKNGKYWIAFVGDSITSTEWVHPNWREIVEYVLKDKLQSEFSDWRTPSWGMRCFNWGFDGATTKDIVENSGEIIAIKPDLIIALMGGNDPTLGVKPEETKKNIEKLFQKFGENQAEVFWMTSTPDLYGKKDKTYSEYREATLDINTSRGQTIFDMFTEYKKYDLKRFYTFISEGNEVEHIKAGDIDPDHPNQLGNSYIAKIVLKEAFDVDFDPEKYIKTTSKGYKFPEY